MKFITQIKLSQTDKKEILNLWNNEYPAKLNYQTQSEFEAYLENLSEQSHIIMKDEDLNIKGWYFDFIREHQRWFAIILDSKFHGKGLGTKLLNLGKEKESELNAWVIDKQNNIKRNGALYASPLNFYLKNGFKQLDNERLELPNISAVKIRWKK